MGRSSNHWFLICVFGPRFGRQIGATRPWKHPSIAWHQAPWERVPKPVSLQTEFFGIQVNLSRPILEGSQTGCISHKASTFPSLDASRHPHSLRISMGTEQGPCVDNCPFRRVQSSTETLKTQVTTPKPPSSTPLPVCTLGAQIGLPTRVHGQAVWMLTFCILAIACPE